MSSLIEIADNTPNFYTPNDVTVNPFSQVETLRQLILVAGHAR